MCVRVRVCVYVCVSVLVCVCAFKVIFVQDAEKLMLTVDKRGYLGVLSSCISVKILPQQSRA